MSHYLTDEMIDLLREGAKTSHGRCCVTLTEARRLRHAIDALLSAGLVRWGDNGQHPHITDAGRAAIDAPTHAEMQRRELSVYSVARPAVSTPRETALQLSRRKNERVAFQICIHDESPTYIRLSLDGNPARAQNLYRNAHSGMPVIVVTQRDGKFAVAHIRGLEVIKFGFVQERTPLLAKDFDWTVDDKRAWRTMRLEMLSLRRSFETKAFRRARHYQRHSGPRVRLG